MLQYDLLFGTRMEQFHFEIWNSRPQRDGTTEMTVDSTPDVFSNSIKFLKDFPLAPVAALNFVGAWAVSASISAWI